MELKRFSTDLHLKLGPGKSWVMSWPRLDKSWAGHEMSSQVLWLEIRRDQYWFVNTRRGFHWWSSVQELKFVPGGATYYHFVLINFVAHQSALLVKNWKENWLLHDVTQWSQVSRGIHNNLYTKAFWNSILSFTTFKSFKKYDVKSSLNLCL